MALRMRYGERRAARRRFDLHCEVIPDEGRTRFLRLTELTATGAFLVTRNPPPVGTHLELVFDVEGRDQRVRGEVVEVRGRGGRAGVVVALPGAPRTTLEAIRAALRPPPETTPRASSNAA